jgi:hypothetical protein
MRSVAVRWVRAGVMACLVLACGGREASTPDTDPPGTTSAALEDEGANDGAKLASAHVRLSDESTLRLAVTEEKAGSVFSIVASLDTPNADPSLRRALVRGTSAGPRELALAYGVLVVTSVLTGAISPGDEGPVESVTFTYGEIHIHYSEQGRDAGAPRPSPKSLLAIADLSTSIVRLAGGPESGEIATLLLPRLNLPNACSESKIGVIEGQ